jgi:hypothetical protein
MAHILLSNGGSFAWWRCPLRRDIQHEAFPFARPPSGTCNGNRVYW